MIQSIRPVNATPIRQNNVTSFGYSNDYGKENKAKAIAKLAVKEFAIGAAISLVFDGGANLLKKVFPKLQVATIPAKSMASRAGVFGALFAATTFVVSGMLALMNKNKH